MLNITGMNRFYHIRNFTDMRCKYSRILAVIRHQLGREPQKDEVFIVMSKNRRLVRLFSFDRISFSLYEKRFAPKYQFMQALAYEVYMKNVTIGNLHKWVQDMGMSVSKNTLRNWLKKGKKHLDSLIPILKESALEKDAIVNCDETWCKVRRFNRYTKKYMWVLVNKAQGIVIFFYDEGSRDRKVLTDFLGEADLKALMSDGYNAYTFLDGELEKTDHLICMALARVKFEKAYQHGEDTVAKEFADMIFELYDLEDGYEMRGLSTEDIETERQGNHTEDIVRRIRKRLDEERRKDNEFRSPYMMQALNYLGHFWDGLFLYRKDGSYPIDNNLAERSVRPFTTKRKCSLHFGSDEGVEMSAVYHSIISTLKLCGKSVWNFFGDYFRCEVHGLETYKEYLPALSNKNQQITWEYN